jgi:hypothetical protein
MFSFRMSGRVKFLDCLAPYFDLRRRPITVYELPPHIVNQFKTLLINNNAVAFSPHPLQRRGAFPHLCLNPYSPISLSEKAILSECPRGGFPFARCSPK